MSGEDDDLLGQIISQTIEGVDEPLKPKAPEPIDPRLQEGPERDRPHRWSHDPDLKGDIAGLRTGHRFEFVDCGEDLDGAWEILGMNLSHPNPGERTLTAGRPGAGPPFIKMSELDFLDEMRQGRVKII